MTPLKRLQASRWPVGGGAVLALLALLAPWLAVGGGTRGLWGASSGVDMAAARTVSGLLVVALAILGLRLATRAWGHHAKAWRRSVALAGACLAAAVVVGLWLPAEGPCLPGAACGAGPFTPSVGWWAAAAAAGAVFVGRWMAREPPGAAAAMAMLRGGGPPAGPQGPHP